MIHTILADDSTDAGRRIISEAQRAHKGVTFQNPAQNGCPEGYTCGEEAYQKSKKMFDAICRKYGILE